MSFKIVLTTLVGLISLNAWAHGDNSHNQEDRDPIVSMIPLPVSVDFSGNLSWGYNIDFSGSGMSMSSDTMDMGDDSSMDMGDDSSMDMGDDSSMDMGDDSSMDMGDDSSMDMGDSWMYMVMPMISLGVNNYTRILNQETSNTLELNSSESNYIAIENKSIVVGGGAGIMAMPPLDIPMFSIRVSLMPYKGGHVFRLKQIDSKKDVGSLKEMVIPHTLEDLREWKTGDRMAYSSKGGIMFGAGVGFSVLASAMTTYMSEGTWAVTVSKLDQASVYVSVQKRDMKMLGMKISNAFVELSSSQMKHFDGDFNFILDLASEKGLQCYRKILSGDILFAQEAFHMGENGVELISRTKTSSRGRVSRRSFGLPYLFNIRRQTSSMNSDSHLLHGFSGEEYKSYMSMYRSTVETDGRLSNQKNSGVLFMGMTNESLNHPEQEVGFGGTFKWFFQKDNTSKSYMRWQLNRLIHKFGLSRAADLVIPDSHLGFVRAEVDLSLNYQEVKTLLENTDVESLYDIAYNNAYAEMNNYFSNAQNVAIHCGKNRAGICMKKLYKATWSALSRLPGIIKNLKKSYTNKNYKDFNMHFGKLGRLALTNRFVLGEIFKRAGKTNISGVLKIQGSKLLQAKIAL